MTPILMAAFGIGFLIFIHEFGHYLCARLAGVRVEVFSLGFGHRLFGFVWRGTDYRVSLIPFGGYVRVAGEDPTQRQYLAPDDLHAKGFGARFLFFSGGVIMNLLFALIAFPAVFKHGVDFTAPVIGAVSPGGGAWEAGLQPGDRVLSIDGKRLYSFENMRVEIALAGDRAVPFEIERDDSTFTCDVQPRYDKADGLFVVGIEPTMKADPVLVTRVDAKGAAADAGLETGDQIVEVNQQAALGREGRNAIRSARAATGKPLDLVVTRDGERHEITYLPDTKLDKQARIGVLSAARMVRGLRKNIPVLERLKLERGDVILSVDGVPFAGDGLEFARSGAPELELEVRRGEGDQSQTESLKAEVTPEERVRFVENVALAAEETGVFLRPLPESPAARAGVVAGDQVLAVNGNEISKWPELIDAVEGAGESALRFRLRKPGATESREISVTPSRESIVDFAFDAQLPAFVSDRFRVDTVGGAVEAGFVASVDLIKQLYVTLKRLFTGDVAASNLGGIIRISQASYHFAERGWAVFLYFLALLSINLAFINVLPIPVLDGGHLMFLIIEKVKGSPVSVRVLTYSQILGLVFVIALMLFVTYNDILKLL